MWWFVSICRYGFTFLGLESKSMKILNRNNDIELWVTNYEETIFCFLFYSYYSVYICATTYILIPLCSSQRYELLHVLNFDPVRRRMSVIVRSKSGELDCLCNNPDSECDLALVFSPHRAVFVCVQATHCSSVREQTLPSFPASDRRRLKEYACMWSAMQQWVTLANCLSKWTCFCFKYELYDSSVEDCCALFV